jgi:hypothetical protein
VTARDLPTTALSDAEHLAEATSRGSIIVTHNGNDFRNLCTAWRVWRRLWEPGEVPQRTRLSYTRAANEIGTLLMREPNMWNQIWYFDLAVDGWVRQL